MSLFLTFRLGAESYAVSADTIQEIAAYPAHIAAVPTAPSWIRGVFNLRGSVLPAVDLGNKVGLGTTAPGKRTCVLVAHFNVDDLPLSLGLIVDAVTDMADVAASSIEPPPAFGSTVNVRGLIGTVRQADRIVCVLDLEALFRTDELLAASLTEARARAAAVQKRESPITAAIPATAGEAAGGLFDEA